MGSVKGYQTHCARCRVRFAEPLHGRAGTICEDCEAAELVADQRPAGQPLRAGRKAGR